MRPHRRWLTATALIWGASVVVTGRALDLGDTIFDALAHPAIAYRAAAATDPVARLAQGLQDGSVRLSFDRTLGYLPSLLRALDVPVESQIAVFSRGSLQASIISPTNPRAIYFNDQVAVAWPRGGFIELAAHDARQGVRFYALAQQETPAPQIAAPGERCLTCHYSYATLGVPGMLVRSVVTDTAGTILPYLGNYVTDDRSPLDERWAGWFVTGNTGNSHHLGNSLILTGTDTPPTVRPTASALATHAALAGYPTSHSDIAALLVFDHEMRMINLLTRVGWEVRLAAADGGDVETVSRETARELVDALLFVGEAPLAGPFVSSSGFAAAFAGRGPFDRQGRSLRQLDLRARLMRYPCSFMIYSPAFDALPATIRNAVYERLWFILSGRETAAPYEALADADRQAILEILRETKDNLPDYFQASSS